MERDDTAVMELVTDTEMVADTLTDTLTVLEGVSDALEQPVMFMDELESADTLGVSELDGVREPQGLRLGNIEPVDD